MVGYFGMSQSFKGKHFVSMSLATREALSWLSTFLENSLVMQINSGVKQREEKSVLLAFGTVKSRSLVYLTWTLCSPLTKASEKMD